MQWRRGLVLAGIHVVVAASALVQQEAGVWPMVKADAAQAVHFRDAAWQESPMFDFKTCDDGIFDLGPTLQGEVVEGANLPVVLLTEWHQPCYPASSGLTGIVEAWLGRNMRRSEIAICSTLCVLVFIEWLLLGGYPVVQPRWRCLEPGALITIWTALCMVLTLTPVFQEIVWILNLLVALVWFYWFLVLIWKALRFGWRRWVVRAEVN